MKKLDKLHFFIHGFCHAEMTASGRAAGLTEAQRRYLARENRCAELWRARIRSFSGSEALLTIPSGRSPGGPTAEYESLARTVLGDRCFVLDCPMPLEESFWTGMDERCEKLVFSDLRDVFLGQGRTWNKEEILTALHTVKCCLRFGEMLAERGYEIAAGNVSAEAWGASFEGCVTKYSLNLQRLLGLHRPADIIFDMTVPDALFLLDAVAVETVLPAERLRLFLMRAGGETIALYVAATHAPNDNPMAVELKIDPSEVVVRSKQGIRLWPQPECYHLPSAGFGYYEPPQELVRVENGRLRVPVTAGFVYRLAKAPAYIFAAPGLSYERFRDALVRAEIVA